MAAASSATRSQGAPGPPRGSFSLLSQLLDKTGLGLNIDKLNRVYPSLKAPSGFNHWNL
jgi:hypothetical protein